MPTVAGGLVPRPQFPPVVGGSAHKPPQRPSPHCRVLATGLREEKFIARYCWPTFILAFGFKYAWNVWRRCSHLQTVYDTAKNVFYPVIVMQKNISKKTFYLHQPHFGFGRDEVFSSETLYALLISSKGQNTAI